MLDNLITHRRKFAEFAANADNAETSKGGLTFKELMSGAIPKEGKNSIAKPVIDFFPAIWKVYRLLVHQMHGLCPQFWPMQLTRMLR